MWAWGAATNAVDYLCRRSTINTHGNFNVDWSSVEIIRCHFRVVKDTITKPLVTNVAKSTHILHNLETSLTAVIEPLCGTDHSANKALTATGRKFLGNQLKKSP